jgi:hypothetical protein
MLTTSFPRERDVVKTGDKRRRGEERKCKILE